MSDTNASRILWQALTTPASPDDLNGYDPEVADALSPLVDRFCRVYFRMEVEGFEHVPDGPTLVVGNHEAGLSFPALFGFGARWILVRGSDDPLRGLGHDLTFRIPLINNLLVRFGDVRANHDHGNRLLRMGQKVLVFPGGDVETFRPYSKRAQVDFNGRKGFLRLALRNQVPITPLVFVGGQESFFVLSDGRKLARALRLHKWARTEVLPIFLGLPWGLTVGPWAHIALPSRSQIRVLPPISLAEFGPEDEHDSEVLDHLYRLVVRRIQAAMDDLYAQRRWPVLG